ncbi:tyrosine recombinase XerC [Streptosporangium lutulentum]
MMVVPFPTPPAETAGGESVAVAVDRYLDSVQTKTTRDSYAETLARLATLAGDRPAAVLTPEDYAAVMNRWDGAAAATWNRHLSALTSFTAWAGRQEILTTNPGRRLERRKPARRGDRSIPRTRLDKLFTDDRHGLRERVLWRMLYETAARAEELLSLNIEDLDLEFRRGRVTSKGGATEYVHWATGNARLLPRLLRGRTTGPLFLADRRAPAAGSRAPAAADICPETGRGRCPTRAPNTCSSRPPPPSTRTGPGGRSTSCGTPRSSTWPSTAAPPPSSKPSPGTCTWAASAGTSNSENRPPHRSPPTPTPTPPHDAGPANRRSAATCIGTVNGDNSGQADPLTPFSVRLQLDPQHHPAARRRKR